MTGHHQPGEPQRSISPSARPPSLEQRENLDPAAVAATCARLFRYRQQQAWPPAVQAGAGWDTLYLEAAEGLSVLPTVEEAVTWVNEFIERIAAEEALLT